MNQKRTVVLLNKNARQLRKRRQEILTLLENSNRALDIRLLSPKKLNQALRECLNLNPDRVIIGGGDGTIVSAAHIVAKTKVELAILPLGTTNSFARSLGIPLELEPALKIALDGSGQHINLGCINDHHFVSVAACGLSEAVASNIDDRFKRRLGRFAYLFAGTWEFLRSKPFDVQIKTDKKNYSFRSHQIVIANARYHGSLPVMQDASVHQDVLVILSFGNSGTKLEHLRNLFRFLRGTHTKSPESIVLKTTTARIETSPVKNIEIDGEVLSKTPAEIRLDKEALRLVLP